jgi:hypothetical protein
MAVTFQIETDIKTAKLAVTHAQAVREYHRRRSDRGSEQREWDIREAQERIQRAMKPLRTWQGKAPYATQTELHKEFTRQVSEVSKDLQRERRKLWKMSTVRLTKQEETQNA